MGLHKRVIFIGQAPARPDSKHGVAGTYVSSWLTKIGLTETDITANMRFYALIGFYPGHDDNGHLKPTKKQIADHRPVIRICYENFNRTLWCR